MTTLHHSLLLVAVCGLAVAGLSGCQPTLTGPKSFVIGATSRVPNRVVIQSPYRFYLTEFSASRAVFQNPRHDYPKQIIYERTGDALTATIGYIVGGSPRRFEFRRQASTGTNP
ncbi:MAG: hypothetical protein Fur0036_01690 [Fimbriimonadaceae bacterium]